MSSTIVSPEMGAVILSKGVQFRVWAPNADSVSVIGTFNNWDPQANPMQPEDGGYWATTVDNAKAGDEYRLHIRNGDSELSRIDPYAKEVTNSIGNGVIHKDDFDWGGDDFQLDPHNQLVIYELHIGTFNDPEGDGSGTFATAIKRLGHLKRLGINAIEILPVSEFAGDRSWGYNPSHLFAVETAFGGPVALKKFIKKAHSLGIAVIMDVVYNHAGPGDLDMWQFDGWKEHDDKGGIYFYNDHRSNTPWGDTRFDYGRPEVVQLLRDNALYWLEEFHVDGLRFDATVYIRTVDMHEEIPDGWAFLHQVNSEIRQRFPNSLLIAEDLQNEAGVTHPDGAAFHAQWGAEFVHPVRAAVITPADEHRSMNALARALSQKFNEDVFQRVIYSESHDEVANGKQRIISEIDPEDPRGWFARRRSSLAAGLVLTAPGIPMLFQGQTILEDGWFDDTVPLDWDLAEDYRGINILYRDLIALRRNLKNTTRGLTGQHVDVYRKDEEKNLLIYHRYMEGGPADSTVVIAHFANEEHADFRIGLPAPGTWHIRFRSDCSRYSEDYDGPCSGKLQTQEMEWDNQPHSVEITLPPYTLMILSQDKQH